MNIGKKKIHEDCFDISEIYKEYSLSDEKSADILKNNGFYSQAIYMYIQSMEKYVKYGIARKININIPNNAQMVRDTGHSLKKSIDVMVQIYSSNDDILKSQISDMINNNVLKGLDLNFIQNNLRYPHYDIKYKDYYTLECSKKDCILIKEMLLSLKKYIDSMINLF